LAAAVRPYPRAAAGEPLEMDFDPRSGVFRLVLRDDRSVAAPTELFVPDLQYPRGYAVAVSDGEWKKRPFDQILEFRHGRTNGEHTLRLERL
jgi:endoglycosylceramidase